MDLKNEIIEILAGILEVDKDGLTIETTMEDLVEWDSIRNVIIISSLEEHYNIVFSDDALFELTSVDSIVKEVSKLI
jgi:acyl carrier protein